MKGSVKSQDTRNESTTTRTAGGLDFTAIGGKRQGREAPGRYTNNHPFWKTQTNGWR